MVFDNIIVTGSHNICAMADLQACYDRQLSKIGTIVQKVAGAETKTIKLVTKMLPTMDNYVSIDFGVSKAFYGKYRSMLAGTGQGNVVSVNICRDLSCIILKYI